MRALQQALFGGGILLLVLGIALMLIDVSRLLGIGVTVIGAAAMGASLAMSLRAARGGQRRDPRRDPRP